MKKILFLFVCCLAIYSANAQVLTLKATFKGTMTYFNNQDSHGNMKEENQQHYINQGDPDTWASVYGEDNVITHVVMNKDFVTIRNKIFTISSPSDAKINYSASNSIMTSDGSYLYFVSGTKTNGGYFAGLYNDKGDVLYDFDAKGSFSFSDAIYYDGSWKIMIWEMDMQTYKYNSKVYELNLPSATRINSVTSDNHAKSKKYNLSGVEVDESYKGILVTEGKTYLNK